METFNSYLMAYGYFAIFFFLMLGITGIPSPEESFMLFIGMAISQGSLSFVHSIIYAILGVMTGMIASYTFGYYLGKAFIDRFGVYVGLTNTRWQNAATKFEKHARWAILVGYFVPGIRQLTPYIAGTSRFSFLYFTILASFGAVIWTITFISLGYFMGNKVSKLFHLRPEHIAFIVIIFVSLFIFVSIIQLIKRKKEID